MLIELPICLCQSYGGGYGGGGGGGYGGGGGGGTFNSTPLQAEHRTHPRSFGSFYQVTEVAAADTAVVDTVVAAVVGSVVVVTEVGNYFRLAQARALELSMFYYLDVAGGGGDRMSALGAGLGNIDWSRQSLSKFEKK